MNFIANGLVAVVLGLVMLNTDVHAQQPPQTNDIFKMADKYCSPKSLAISKAMVNQAASIRKESDGSAIIDPVVKMLLRHSEIMTIIALENLVTQCAILKALDRGV